MSAQKDFPDLSGPSGIAGFSIDSPSDFPSTDFFAIDTSELDSESKQKADEVLRAISDLWAEPGFLETHSFLSRRLQIELETLRGLLKMRSSDDLAHEALLSAISEDKSNPSLYRSLAEIQKMYSSLSTQISELIEKLERMLREYQERQTTQPALINETSSNLRSRGTKELLQQLSD